MNKRIPTRYQVWLISITFLIFQFFLQLSSGTILTSITTEIPLTALATGILGSAFYYIYTAMQIPVGILFDRYKARFLLASNALICAIGCLIFSVGDDFSTLFIGRFLMGAGSSFAFIGMSRMLVTYFPLNQFSFMIGLSETLGFTLCVSGIIGLGYLIELWGWRDFITGAGMIGILISLFCWKLIPNDPVHLPPNISKNSLKNILKNKTAWFNGLFVGLMFSVVTVFGAFWAVPFVQLKIECSLFTATLISSMILLGAGFSCPIYGKISIAMDKRRPLMHFSCLSTFVILLIILFIPISNGILLGALMLLAGLCCGAYLLSYTIAIEISEEHAKSTSTGFTNTLAMVTAPILQPFIGFLLDWQSMDNNFSLQDFQYALLLIPGVVLIADLLVFFLPEKMDYVFDRKQQ